MPFVHLLKTSAASRLISFTSAAWGRSHARMSKDAVLPYSSLFHVKSYMLSMLISWDFCASTLPVFASVTFTLSCVVKLLLMSGSSFAGSSAGLMGRQLNPWARSYFCSNFWVSPTTSASTMTLWSGS